MEKDVNELVAMCAMFLQDVDDLVASYPAIKRAKQMMQMAYDSLVKGGSMSLAEAKAYAQKLRNATRDLNTILKQIRRGAVVVHPFYTIHGEIVTCN